MSEPIRRLNIEPRAVANTGDEQLLYMQQTFREEVTYMNYTSRTVFVKTLSGLNAPVKPLFEAGWTNVSVPPEYINAFVVRHTIYCDEVSRVSIINAYACRARENPNIKHYKVYVDSLSNRTYSYNGMIRISIDFIYPDYLFNQILDGGYLILDGIQAAVSLCANERPHPLDPVEVLDRENAKDRSEIDDKESRLASLSMDIYINAPNREVGRKFVKIAGEVIELIPMENPRVPPGVYIYRSGAKIGGKRSSHRLTLKEGTEYLNADNGFYDSVEEAHHGTDSKLLSSRIEREIQLEKFNYDKERLERARENEERKSKVESVQSKTRIIQEMMKLSVVLIPLATTLIKYGLRFVRGLSKIMAQGAT